MIHIYIFPTELKVLSRRMVIRHQNSLEKQEVKEIITLVNEGKDPITEIYFEMEEFRNELNVTDDQGNIVPFRCIRFCGPHLDNPDGPFPPGVPQVH